MGKFRSSFISKPTIKSEYKEGAFQAVFKPPFKELDLVFFQKMLIMPGIHCFSVTSLSEGRKALFTLLSSIPLYQRKACISTNFEIIGEPFSYNLYQKLNEIQQKDRYYSLEQLWAEGQHFDFLWIEKSEKDNPLYIKFCEQVLQIYKHKDLCVIILEEKI